MSVVHIVKAYAVSKPMLDGEHASRVSAYLVDGTVDSSPVRLKHNPYFSLGSKIYGQGFLFADNDPKCTPKAVREQLLAKHPDWEQRMPPYVGGEEINSDPLHASKRFVIALSDISDESELCRWPELAAIVEEKVKPERLRLGNNPNNVPLKRRWWAYQAHRPELYSRIASAKRVLAISQVSTYPAFAFLAARMIYSHKVVVFPLASFAAFAALQSLPHDIWARFFGSTLGDAFHYTPSDCFETFPFPNEWTTDPTLEAAGRAYYEFRAALMVHNAEGMTKTYHRFHNPEEPDSDIFKLRSLHTEMDRAVLGAYGWHDVLTDCEFLLDYEVEDDESGRRKKPYRYRWPDEVRDEVLARLIELNGERAAAERLEGAGRALSKKTVSPSLARAGAPSNGQELF